MSKYWTIPLSLTCLLISLAIHLVIYLILSIKISYTPQEEPAPPRVLRIERIVPRTIGVKQGSKDFMPEFEKGIGQTENQKQQTPQQAQPPLSFESLKAENLQLENIRPMKQQNMQMAQNIEKSNVQISSHQVDGRENIRQEIKRERVRDQNKILQEFSRSQSSAEAIAGKGFALDFIPPEGVSEDELNSMEKMFFSFQRRTFITYVGSFIKSYETVLRQKPNLKNALQTQSHHLAARVTFDDQGNIQLIKIIKSVPNDDVHLLFEETLKGMLSLPNPPKDLIEEDGTFTIYFQLKIN